MKHSNRSQPEHPSLRTAAPSTSAAVRLSRPGVYPQEVASYCLKAQPSCAPCTSPVRRYTGTSPQPASSDQTGYTCERPAGAKRRASPPDKRRAQGRAAPVKGSPPGAEHRPTDRASHDPVVHNGRLTGRRLQTGVESDSAARLDRTSLKYARVESVPLAHRTGACLLRRRVALQCVLPLTLFLVTGCGGASHSGVAATSTPAPASATHALEGRAQAAILRLPVGYSSASYKITALPPVRNTFDVRIVTPASVDFNVHIRTWYGESLSVTDSRYRDRHTGRPSRLDPFCKTSRERLTCLLRYPRLPAQRAGPWTVIVTKRSKPAATIPVSVTFRSAPYR